MSCVPYPRKYESFNSWDYRCGEAEKDSERYNRFLNFKATNWGGYNYRPVNGAGIYTTPLGTKINALRVYPSKSKLGAARNYALKTGACFLIRVQLGNPNIITSREDYIVCREFPPLDAGCVVEKIAADEWTVNFWKREKALSIYNNDNH